MDTQRLPHLLIACSLEITGVAREVQLLPEGAFAAVDGRPGPGRAWRLTAEDAARVIARAKSRTTPIPIDYEHQTLNAETNGQPAPAAGWFRELAFRPGQGLFAVGVAWTDKARAMIETGEYRFISPVFIADPKSGAVQELLHAGLTNVPALHGMQELLAARFDHQRKEPKGMNDKLAELLGLPLGADEATILQALQDLKKKADEAGQVTAQAAARAKSEPDPALFAPVAALKALADQVAALRTQMTKGEAAALLEQGVKSGKIVPAMEPWARKLGESDPAALREFLATSQAVALSSNQTGGTSPAIAASALTEAEQTVCRAMGLKPEQFIAARPAEGV